MRNLHIEEISLFIFVESIFFKFERFCKLRDSLNKDRPVCIFEPVRIFEDWPFSLYIVAASESDEGLVCNDTSHTPVHVEQASPVIDDSDWLMLWLGEIKILIKS